MNLTIAKLRLLMLALLLSIPGTSFVFAQPAAFTPVTDATLQKPDAADWLMWRRDQTVSGYSPLDQINKQNVGKLRLAWAGGMESGQAEQEPIVYKGVMYLPHNGNVVQALDAKTGNVIWEYRRKLERDMLSGTTRNILLYRDRIYMTTLDSYVVALDARTGKLVWETKAADHKKRVDFSSGPMAGDGKIFAGMTCGVGTPEPCSVSAYDAETGKQLWRRESVAGPSDPPEAQASWGGAPYEQRRKASFWLTGSYDPQLKLVYWTTASPYPYPEILKGTGSGSLLYSNSILALDAATGAIKWYFQMQPRDNFDMDHQDNPILANTKVGGADRKVVYVLGKPGILWAFDREKGGYLWHKQVVPFQNLYKNIDPKTGAITTNTDIIPKKIGDVQKVCPGMRGGKLFQSKAYSPKNNAVFAPVSNECVNYEVMPLDKNASGVKYDEIQHMEGSGGNVGRLMAVNGSTGAEMWRFDTRAAMGSPLATGGGLVFVGDMHRNFRALDADTGKVLWEIPLSAPITGYPISYAVDGKQYVAIAIGGRTAGSMHLAQLYPELKGTGGSNTLMVFALE
jgi:alcohol dehydrogenase (cytochrome c)